MFPNFLINMVNLKATIRVRTKNGLYPVYIRFTKGNQVSYVKTSWVVNDKGLWRFFACSGHSTSPVIGWG